MESNKYKVICFGEVLWDMLPGGALPGGAPMNLAIRLSSFGVNALMVSRIGDDREGHRLKAFMEWEGVDTTLLQVDSLLKTGQVNVTLGPDGDAAYDIVYPSAWDNIHLETKAVKACQKADVLVFGSLACRSRVTENTLRALIENASYKVFDVNLRPPHYRMDKVIHLMGLANLLKMNDEELITLTGAMGCSLPKLSDRIRFLSDETGVTSICVTKGSRGACWYVDGSSYKHSGYPVQVADTVGAGDSFLATLLYGRLKRASYRETLARACAVGALVVSRKGATSAVDEQEIRDLMTGLAD